MKACINKDMHVLLKWKNYTKMQLTNSTRFENIARNGHIVLTK
jgi:hypothetical protein